MEFLSIANILQFLLIFLLLVLGLYMVSINRKLNTLRKGEDSFKAIIIELNQATNNAQTAITGLKMTVRDAEQGLDGNLKQARAVIEELKFLTDKAALIDEEIPARTQSRKPGTMNLANVGQSKPRPQRAKNFADKTLEKVQGNQEQLPNPLLGTRSDEFEPQPTQRGIGDAHKEMALKRRDEALRAMQAQRNLADQRDIADVNASQRQNLGTQQVRPTPRAAERPVQSAPRPNVTANSDLNRPQIDVGRVSLNDLDGAHRAQQAPVQQPAPAQQPVQTRAAESVPVQREAGYGQSQEALEAKKKALLERLGRTR